MKEFPAGITFKYSWRKYQERVLSNLEQYLQDDHLHVIAPPGSGKTVLGLEVALRINQPVLILAPTVAIKNQWIHKFCSHFLQTNQIPEWISGDIHKPQFMTVTTYQGLHAACSNKKVLAEVFETDDRHDFVEPAVPDEECDNIDKIISTLKENNIKTIVVDEAHHLKNEWWNTLIKIKQQLDPVIVGLTATPPYDVTPGEWQRYIELNGPVDVEISVPELVIESDLCPHQDYVYLSAPTPEELNKITEFRRGMEDLFNELKTDATLIEAIQLHPLWINAQDNLEWIYTNISWYSASLIFLNGAGIKIPQDHLDIIDDKDVQIPHFDYEWAETLLTFYLYKDAANFKAYKDHQKALEHKLHKFGAADKCQVYFTENRHVTDTLATSVSKLEGIQQIVDFEYKQLGHELRLVVLTDYIRKEFFGGAAGNDLDLNKIGVLTIFEKLRRNNAAGIKLGVLTGSIIVIPKEAFAALKQKLADNYTVDVTCNSIPFDEDYVLIEESEKTKNHIVDVVTEIFQEGGIEVLVGTKSLLGEGWDAPAINSLILASFVGSFVLSNQMRGRAIRTHRDNPGKTGTIWHLCCVDPTAKDNGHDMEVLRRRFKGFVGISVKNEGQIENGLSRLGIPEYLTPEIIAGQNKQSFQRAGDREALKEYWLKSLSNGVNLIEEVKIPFASDDTYTSKKSLHFNNTIKYLFVCLVIGIADYLFGILEAIGRMRLRLSLQDAYHVLVMISVIGLLIFGHLAYKSFTLFAKYRDIAKDIEKIGKALLATQLKMGLVKTDTSLLSVDTMVDKFGAVYCHLEGGSNFEKSQFINMLQEIIMPVDNPRYVIVRKSRFLFFLNQSDFHSVPEYIGRNKNNAMLFAGQWLQYVGQNDLIYTRTRDGRQMLLKSRLKSLAAQFSKPERINKWK
ncbi:MAG: DEAD/DEAH box helicase family protein [Mucilaginibacter sp.]